MARSMKNRIPISHFFIEYYSIRNFYPFEYINFIFDLNCVLPLFLTFNLQLLTGALGFNDHNFILKQIIIKVQKQFQWIGRIIENRRENKIIQEENVKNSFMIC